jgi:RNA polymerase sigma factor (sigma-70 family)
LKQSTAKLVEHLFRTQAGKLVATLTRIFGTAHIQLAEDIVQETLISALNNWSTKEIPDNPSAWLMQVAKRKTLNELRRIKLAERSASNFTSFGESDFQIDDFFMNEEIKDSQLRMIFTCCHASLNTESQITLILKTLCGFGVKEVANALLTSESTINKRLYRAKASIRQSDVPFVVPMGNELEKQLPTVCLALYLMFNEGYNTSNSQNIIKKDLCLEAIRLTKLLADQLENEKSLYALLALMCFHTARFDARIDHYGALIIFEDQNRDLWNKELINAGVYYLHKSSNSEHLTNYHLEAGIAAEHCLAKSFDQTNWKSIFEQYTILYKLKSSPVIALNLAIIKSKLEGEEASLLLLEELANREELQNYYLLPATQGIFYMKLKQYFKAEQYLKKAVNLTNSPMEISFLKRKIGECLSLQRASGAFGL